MKKSESLIKTILFTGGGGAGNELIWRTLKKKYKIYFCDINIENINAQIPEKNIFRVPSVKDYQYINHVKKICDDNNIDIVVPGIDEELIKFKKNESLFKKVFLPSYEMIKTCNDKWLFYLDCKKKKINVPTTSLANKFDKKKHKKKLVLKPRFGRGSKGIIYCKDSKIAKMHLKILSLENKIKDYIIQDYISGKEYTITQYYNYQSYFFPLLVHEKKGITNKASANNDNSVSNFCNQIGEKFKGEKIFNIQLIKKKNKCYLIEINPRISTTFCFFIANGFDPFRKDFKINKKFKFKFLIRQVENVLK